MPPASGSDTRQPYGTDSLVVTRGSGGRTGSWEAGFDRLATRRREPIKPVWAVMPRILCTTVHATTQDPYATDERHTCCVSVWAATRGGVPLRHWLGNGGRGGWCRRVLSSQLFEQRLGLLEVGRVKALGEPAVDLGQQVVRLLPFPLLLPQPRQAHRRPQFQRFRLLAAGNGQGLLEVGFRLVLRRPRLPQE